MDKAQKLQVVLNKICYPKSLTVQREIDLELVMMALVTKDIYFEFHDCPGKKQSAMIALKSKNIRWIFLKPFMEQPAASKDILFKLFEINKTV